MPDVLHWLGIRRIDRLVSMSNLKYDAMVRSGIDIVERVPIPAEHIPADAQVEIEAKKAAGYYALESPTRTDLEVVKGRADRLRPAVISPGQRGARPRGSGALAQDAGSRARAGGHGARRG